MNVISDGIPILGVPYSVTEGTEHDFPALKSMDGYCDTSTKRIVVSDMSESSGDPDAKGDLYRYKRQLVRHELVHAFLYESGLSASSWADNEEIVDWIAIQAPKLMDAFIAVGAMT